MLVTVTTLNSITIWNKQCTLETLWLVNVSPSTVIPRLHREAASSPANVSGISAPYILQQEPGSWREVPNHCQDPFPPTTCCPW